MKLSELEKYAYEFGEELIAQAPASPRDSAKLLILHRGKGEMEEDIFRNLGSYLKPGSVMVLNETRVIPARIGLERATGGKIKLLYLEGSRHLAKGLSEKRLEAGETLYYKKRPIFKVISKKEREYFLRPLVPKKDLEELFEKRGEAPIPPYIKHSPLKGSRLKKEYQAVFAKKKGSAAAPTASLHFTKRLLRTLAKKGIEIRFITLHVGLGTFAPLEEKNLKSGKLHEEWYEIPKTTLAAIRKAKEEKRPVVAVGTTAARALESWGKTKRTRGRTDLFIRPGFKFQKVDALITNFHVPRSSLLMLVSAFLGREKTLVAYGRAVKKGYRLFSFGDGMLID